MSRDNIYAGKDSATAPFEFNESVANVFPDMLRRSIPGYAESIAAIGSLARRYVQAGSHCYDLGASLGAATLAMRRNIDVGGCRIVAVDNAPAMVRRCRDAMRADDGGVPVDVIEADVRDVPIENASMVVMNYTLQFLPPDERCELLRRIRDGMRQGGVLVLSEKVVHDDPVFEELLVDLHLEHKRRNDYSALEISRKRAALENVLVPDSVQTHIARLTDAGFRHAGVWLRWFNFVSLVAIR
jgi:tRNA (cmo5U34)-methyltransferase